jgi:hypothetical protein
VKVEFELSDEQVRVIARHAAEFVDESPERWLSQKELANHFGCSVRTVLNYQRAGMPHLVVGNKPRFRASDCDAWLTARAGRAYDPVGSINGAAPLARPAPGHQEDSS